MARVVVIEDDDRVREMIEAVLSRSGHAVSTHADASSGMSRLEDELASGSERLVVITDIFMPDRDGLELTAEIKRLHPDVRVIAISGGGEYGDVSYLATARAFGADITLPKPFRPAELRAAVNEIAPRPTGGDDGTLSR
ncbi:MAG: response regulator [Spirochaetota bacterium]